MTGSFTTVRKQTEAQLAAQAEMQAIRAQVRDLCRRLGVPTVDLFNYYAFAHELYRVKRQELDEESLELEADIARSKWAARGLPNAVLESIRSDVFCIPAPMR